MVEIDVAGIAIVGKEDVCEIQNNTFNTVIGLRTTRNAIRSCTRLNYLKKSQKINQKIHRELPEAPLTCDLCARRALRQVAVPSAGPRRQRGLRAPDVAGAAARKG